MEISQYLLCRLSRGYYHLLQLPQHKEHVRMVLAQLRKAGRYAKLLKCQFSVKLINFVGYDVTPDGVAMEKKRIQSVLQSPELRSVRDIQVFLGFTNFYRRFIRCYSRIVRPLSQLTGITKAGGKPASNRRPAQLGKEAS